MAYVTFVMDPPTSRASLHPETSPSPHNPLSRRGGNSQQLDVFSRAGRTSFPTFEGQ